MATKWRRSKVVQTLVLEEEYKFYKMLQINFTESVVHREKETVPSVPYLTHRIKTNKKMDASYHTVIVSDDNTTV